jgi:hypothetical protein
VITDGKDNVFPSNSQISLALFCIVSKIQEIFEKERNMIHFWRFSLPSALIIVLLQATDTHAKQ